MRAHRNWLGLLAGMLTAANAFAQDRATPSPAKAALEQTILFPRGITCPVVTEQAIWVGQGGSVAVWNDQLNAVCRLDPSTRRVTATIPLDAQPIALAVGGGAVWVRKHGITASLVRIDEQTLTPAPVSGVGWSGAFPPHPAFGRRSVACGEGAVWAFEQDVACAGSVILYHRGTPSVVRLDPRTGQVLARVPLPRTGRGGIAVGAGAVWVMMSGAVFRIDPVTNQIVATIPVPDSVNDIAVGEEFVWVVHDRFAIVGRDGDGELMRIDPATNQVVGKPIQVPPGFCSLAVGCGAVWVSTAVFSNAASDYVVRIDPGTGRQLGEPISVPHIQKIAAGPCGVWVSCWERPKGHVHVGLLTPILP